MATHPNTGIELPANDASAATFAARHVYWTSALVGGVTGRAFTPPGAPTDGDSYIIHGGTATGVWASHDDEIAISIGGAWYYYTATEGMSIYVQDENIRYDWSGSAWGAAGAVIVACHFTGLSVADAGTLSAITIHSGETYGATGTDTYGFPAPLSGRIRSVTISALHLDASSPPSTSQLVIEPFGGGTDWFAEDYNLNAAASTQEYTTMTNSLAVAQNFSSDDGFQVSANHSPNVNVLILQGTILFEEIP